MKTFTGFCALAALALSLAACGEKNKSADTTAPAAPAASVSSSVAECDAYVDRVNKCMAKLGTDNAMATTYKQQMEAAKAQWATIQDKTALANVCKQANDAFTQSAQMLKCE